MSGEPVRIGFVLGGAASLGAYQAGVLAALVEGLRPLAAPGDGGGPPRLHVDLMTGASSGAINALLAAHCLVHGRDAVAVLRRAWVDEASLPALRNRRFDAPLTLDGLGRITAELVDPTTPSPGRVPTAGGIDVELAVTSLHGFTEPVDEGQHREPSYRGRRRFHVHAGSGVPELGEAVSCALASAANPLGFAPRFVGEPVAATDRSGPGWHTDGGLLDDTLQRALDLANERRHGGAEERMLVVVHPFTSRLPAGSAWSDPAVAPAWTATVLRSLEIQQSQLFADDVQAVHDVNARLHGLAELREVFAQVDPGVLAPILAELGAPAGEGDLAGHLVDEIAERAGVARKQEVHLAVISPDLLAGPQEEAAAPVLSGDLLLGIGGFASRALRASDFDLGYRCALDWLDRDPLRVLGGLSDDDRERVDHQARAAYRPGQGYLVTGGTALRAVGPRALGQLVRLGLHAVGALARDTVRGFRSPGGQGSGQSSD